MGLSEQTKNHVVFIIASAFATGAALSWGVAEKIRVTPKDDEISLLERRIEDLKQNTSQLEAEVKRLSGELEQAQKKNGAPNTVGERAAPNPIISIVDEVRDDRDAPIDKSHAPFKIRVGGTAMNATAGFVYLVVDNGNGQYIEPPGSLGANVDGPFSGYCYLGIMNDPGSLNQVYIVFAVVTDRRYTEYDLLDRATILTKSNELRLTRTR